MATTNRFDRIISADSHVMEPYDLWSNAIGHKYGDRTPRIIHEYKGKKGDFFYSGSQGRPASEIASLNPETDKAAIEAEEKGFEEAGYNSAVRVRWQEEAGVAAEVVNTTRMLGILRNPDREVVRACAEAFNDWAAEFVSYDPKRLIGASVIPMDDVDWATKELERTVKMGLVGPLINCVPPEGAPPYRNRTYDRFWAVAQDADIPVTLHLVTGRVTDPLGLTPTRGHEENEENPALWVELYNEVHAVLASDFIFGKILDRFPKLKVICSEFEMSWVPSFMGRVDQIQSDVGGRLDLNKLEMQASDYMRTRVWHGIIDDPYGKYAIPIVGADRVLWGSDFPHLRSIGLEAQAAVNSLIEDLPFEDQEKIIGGNAVKMFNIDID